MPRSGISSGGTRSLVSLNGHLTVTGQSTSEQTACMHLRKSKTAWYYPARKYSRCQLAVDPAAFTFPLGLPHRCLPCLLLRHLPSVSSLSASTLHLADDTPIDQPGSPVASR